MTPKPPAGHAILRPISKYKAVEGGIEIPMKLRNIRTRTGVCLAFCLWPEGVNSAIYFRGKKRLTPAWHNNDDFRKIQGKTIVAETGRMFTYDKSEFVLVRLEHIIAITDSQDVTTNDAGEVQRCMKCKSAGEANILLDGDGYCMQCGMNSDGQHRSEKQITVSGDEAYAFGRTPAQIAKDNRASGKIIITGK